MYNILKQEIEIMVIEIDFNSDEVKGIPFASAPVGSVNHRGVCLQRADYARYQVVENHRRGHGNGYFKHSRKHPRAVDFSRLVKPLRDIFQGGKP